MKKDVVFILLILVCLGACLDETSTAGGKWVNSSLRTVITDTCTVELATLLADSVSTSGDTVCQIGYYRSELRGIIEGSFFTEYNVATATFLEDVSYRLDSVTITMWPSGNYMGDTLTTQRMHLYRLEETIELDDDNYLYNTSSVRYEDEPLCSFDFRLYPNKREKIQKRLPNEFGQEFMDLMMRGSIAMESQEYFRQYFHGLHIRGDEANNCVSGFMVNDSSMCITLHYQKIEESATELTVQFSPNSEYRFNKASQDRTGTPIELLQPGTLQAMPSKESDQTVYLQGMVGMYATVEFPHLNNLLIEGEMVGVESAILYFFPVDDTYGSETPLPQTLTLYTANDNNEAEGVITDSSGESLQTGNLQENEMEKDGTFYYFDITSFIQSNLGTFGIDRQKLMLMLPNEYFLTTMGGVVIGDMSHKRNSVKLEIVYTAYNKQ